jgi:hypothetical protein
MAVTADTAIRDLPFPLFTPLRGERDYIQGSALFDRLVAMTGARSQLCLTMHRISSQPMRAVPAASKGGTHGYFSFRDPKDGELRYLHLEPDPDAPSPGRAGCNEAQIAASATLASGMARARAGAVGTLAETLVALNKLLIESIFGRDRKLLFASLELDELPPGQSLTELRLLRSLGSRMFVSQITLDGKHAGQIVFMGVPK